MASLISGMVLVCSSFQVNAATRDTIRDKYCSQIYNFNDGIYVRLAEGKDFDEVIITITFANRLDAEVDFFPMGKNTDQVFDISGKTLTLHIDDKYDIKQREIAFIALNSPNSITSIDLERRHGNDIAWETNGLYYQIYVGKYFYPTNTPGNMLPNIPEPDYSTPPTPGYYVPDVNQPGNMLPNIPGPDYSTPPTPGYYVPDVNQPGNMLPGYTNNPPVNMLPGYDLPVSGNYNQPGNMLPNIPGPDYSTPPTPGYYVPDPNQPGNMLPGYNPPVYGNYNQPGNMLPGYNPPVYGNYNQPGNMLPGYNPPVYGNYNQPGNMLPGYTDNPPVYGNYN